MNVEHIHTLAEVIRMQKSAAFGDDSGFCMMSTVHKCGTPSCINGFCKELIEKERMIFDPINDSPFGYIIDYLEVSSEIGAQLYAPMNSYVDFGARQNTPLFITPAHASSVLYNLANTGKVDWSVKGIFPTFNKETTDEETTS